MASDPQSLLTQAQCYQCYASDRGMMTLLKLALLQQIVLAQNPGAATDAQSLLTAANCFSCYGANPGLMMLLKLALLQETDVAAGATDTSSGTLLENAACADCFGGTPGLNGYMELALLAQLLQAVNPAAAVDAPTLMAGVSCYACLLPGQWPLIELQLLCLIAGGTCDPETLLAGVECYECLTPGQWKLLALALYADIVEKKINPIINMKSFVSNPVAINPATTQGYVFAHGLGQTPNLFQVNLVCITADGNTGYQPGQVNDILGLIDTDYPALVAVTADNTNIYCNLPSQNPLQYAITAQNGLAPNQPTFTNFVLVANALLFA
jgi:hypothetical protein